MCVHVHVCKHGLLTSPYGVINISIYGSCHVVLLPLNAHTFPKASLVSESIMLPEWAAAVLAHVCWLY